MNMTTMKIAVMNAAVNRITTASGKNAMVATMIVVDGIMVGIVELGYVRRSTEKIRITAKAVLRMLIYRDMIRPTKHICGLAIGTLA